MASHSHSHGGCDHSHGPAHASEDHADAAVAAAEEEETSGGAERRLLAGLLPPEVTEVAPAASLREEFLRAERLYHHVVDDAGGCEGEHSVDRHVTDALAAFSRCSRIVREEGLFSRNETLDDVAAGALQYLLLEFYIATLRQRRSDNR